MCISLFEKRGPWRRCRTSVLSALKWLLPARDVLGANCKSPQSPESPSCLRQDLTPVFFFEVSGYSPKLLHCGSQVIGHRRQERNWEEINEGSRNRGSNWIKRAMASISRQNSCDLNTCHPHLVPSVTAKALEGSLHSFPTLP